MGGTDFAIEILSQDWLDYGPEAVTDDLCSHGKLRITIGGKVVTSGEEDEGFGVSETALALLRTLESDHSPAAPVAEQLVFHGCSAILMMACPIGMDWTVEHLGDNRVRLSEVQRFDTTNVDEVVTFGDLAVEMDELDYRGVVTRFAHEAEQLFAGVCKNTTDEWDYRWYGQFWQEFGRLLATFSEYRCERKPVTLRGKAVSGIRRAVGLVWPPRTTTTLTMRGYVDPAGQRMRSELRKRLTDLKADDMHTLGDQHTLLAPEQITFRGGIMRPGPTLNLLTLVSRGGISVNDSADGVRVRYHLRFGGAFSAGLFLAVCLGCLMQLMDRPNQLAVWMYPTILFVLGAAGITLVGIVRFRRFVRKTWQAVIDSHTPSGSAEDLPES